MRDYLTRPELTDVHVNQPLSGSHIKWNPQQVFINSKAYVPLLNCCMVREYVVYLNWLSSIILFLWTNDEVSNKFYAVEREMSGVQKAPLLPQNKNKNKKFKAEFFCTSYGISVALSCICAMYDVNLNICQTSANPAFTNLLL